jgi:hypothetical protein
MCAFPWHITASGHMRDVAIRRALTAASRAIGGCFAWSASRVASVKAVLQRRNCIMCFAHCIFYLIIDFHGSARIDYTVSQFFQPSDATPDPVFISFVLKDPRCLTGFAVELAKTAAHIFRYIDSDLTQLRSVVDTLFHAGEIFLDLAWLHRGFLSFQNGGHD